MKRILYSLLLIFFHSFINAQSLSVQLSKTHYECGKGTAGIQLVSGTQPISVLWSTGASNVFSISDLDSGNYYVHIRDAAAKDTIVHFDIQKFECRVSIANQFTPNGDNYNDTWLIAYTENHPRFKLYVYNKWGQQVHFQSGTYTPWNGTQAGLKVADGTYYYVFYFDGNDNTHYLKGDVTILR